MPLDPVSLATGLRQRWLPGEGGFPSSVDESGRRFADVAAPWFAAGAANGFPCTTALARKSQLASGAAAALSSGDARTAGQQLAMAIAQYMAGQTFGAGVSALPIATPALVIALGEVFSAHDLDDDKRTVLMATAMHVTALSTVVTFPPPLPPAVVL